MIHGDRIVAAISFQERVYIFTELGKVYQMLLDYCTGMVEFQLVYTFD